jgi:hypothetical protein
VLKHAHQHIAMPLAANEDSLTHSTFPNEATLFLTGNRAFVESEYAEVDAMKLQLLKSEL